MRFTVKLDTEHNVVPESFTQSGMTLARIDSAPFSLLSLTVSDERDLNRPDQFKQQAFNIFYETLFVCNQVFLHLIDNYADAILNDNDNAGLKSQLLAKEINFEDPLVRGLLCTINENLNEGYATFKQDLQALARTMQLTAVFNEDDNTLHTAFFDHLIAELYVREDLV